MKVATGAAIYAESGRTNVPAIRSALKRNLMKRKFKNWIITLIAKRTGYTYGGSSKTVVTKGFGLFFTKFTSPSVADPAGMMDKGASFHINSKTYRFWKPRNNAE